MISRFSTGAPPPAMMGESIRATSDASGLCFQVWITIFSVETCWKNLRQKEKSCVDSTYIHIMTPTFTKNNDTSSSMSRYVKMVGVDEHLGFSL